MTTIDLRLGRWEAMLADVECDALIVDAPYSERTHAGHNVAVCGDMREVIGYGFMSPSDVDAFVESWAPRTAGWFVTITDHVLAPAWTEALERAGRYVFAPLPFVAPGSRVRLAGDGPSCWTCWVIVARPRSKAFASWGTLPGAYVLPAGYSERMAVVGGKPLWLMASLVRDYSRPGDLVCDPCAGGATTLLASAIEGRRSVGSEMDPATHAKAMKRLARGYTPSMFADEPRKAEQMGLPE